MNNIKKYFLLFPLFSFLFSLFLFCSKNSTQPETVTISGRVILEDTTDYSGVKVSLYKPVELDTAMVRINQQYPNIGVQISQETEFDHREHTPVYSTTTDKNGNWKIEGVSTGLYNIVAEKEGWGWRYVLKNKETNNINIFLYKNIILKNTVNCDTVYLNRTIIIDNCIVPENINITIKGNSFILINDNSSITVLGNLKILGYKNNFIKITNNNYNSNWNMLKINQKAIFECKNVIISNAKIGIYNKSKYFNIKNVIFKKNNIGINNFDINKTIKINNCNFINNKIGIINEAIDTSLIKNNIFYNNEISVKIYSSQIIGKIYNSNIEYNYFSNDNESIYVNYPALPKYVMMNGFFYMNNFHNINNAIYLGRDAFFNGELNNFFKINDKFIYARGTYGQNDTLFFKKNYWGLFNLNDIKLKIFDKEDDSTLGVIVEVKDFLLKPVKY